MRLVVILIVLLTLPAGLALEDYFDVDELTLDASWSGSLITETAPGARLTSLEARVNIAPPDPQTIPEARLENNSLVFEWNELRPRYDYAIESTITVPLTGGLEESVAWPMRTNTVPESELIDYEDPAVRAFASDIAEGETDALRLAVRLADAIREEIAYNLTTLNADATYPASEVLQRKQGVCDEITVLYIASLRALGMEARYVSGYAYTDIFDPDGNWEGHGWAEVRIGDAWVPFDLTYGEYVHLSPAHVPLRRSDDAKVSSISYTWYGNGVEISAEPLETSFEVVNVGEPISFGTLSPEFRYDEVGPGWNVLDVQIRNDLDSFVVPILRMSRTQGLDVPPELTVIIPPNSERTVSVPVRIDGDIKSGYRYTYPVSVQARGFDAAAAQFTATRSGERYDEPQLDDDEREFHPDLDLTCEDAIGLPGDEGASTCTLTNTGNRNLDLRVCADSCRSLTVLIGQTRTVAVPVQLEEGTEQRTVLVRGDVSGSTSIVAWGRSPADVSLDVTSAKRLISVDVLSSHPVEGNLTITIGNSSYSGDLTQTTYEVPGDAFGLQGEATVSAWYTDVDGEHTIEETVTVSQDPLSWIRWRLASLFSRF